MDGKKATVLISTGFYYRFPDSLTLIFALHHSCNKCWQRNSKSNPDARGKKEAKKDSLATGGEIKNEA